MTTRFALPVRTDPSRHALLIREDEAGVRLDTVATRKWTAPVVELSSLGQDHWRGEPARALVLGYTYATPDLERWESWRLRGALRGQYLTPTARDGAPQADLGPLSLWARLRRHHGLARACRHGITAAERAAPHAPRSASTTGR